MRFAFARLGAPFDYGMDMTSCDALACTELVGQAMPQVGFAIRNLYGSPIVMPDDIAAQAIRGEGLRLLAYAYGNPSGWRAGGVPEMMADLIRVWGLPGDGADPSLVGRTTADGRCALPVSAAQ